MAMAVREELCSFVLECSLLVFAIAKLLVRGTSPQRQQPDPSVLPHDLASISLPSFLPAVSRTKLSISRVCLVLALGQSLLASVFWFGLVSLQVLLLSDA